MTEWNRAIEAAAAVCDEYHAASGRYLAVRIRALAEKPFNAVRELNEFRADTTPDRQEHGR